MRCASWGPRPAVGSNSPRFAPQASSCQSCSHRSGPMGPGRSSRPSGVSGEEWWPSQTGDVPCAGGTASRTVVSGLQRRCRGRSDRLRHDQPHDITKSDTDGEVSFAGISTLTNPVFRLVLNVHRVFFRLRHQYQKCPRAEWHEVKLQYTAVSRHCMPLSMVGVAASQLGPACDGMQFDPCRSSCQKATQGTNSSNGR
jgi:hypothetical protein